MKVFLNGGGCGKQTVAAVKRFNDGKPLLYIPLIALPEEDTLFINYDKVEVIGTRPFCRFKNAVREKREIK